MAFRETITPEMQCRWFASVQNDRNLYWIIQSAGHRVGVANLKDIDRTAATAEAGIYIAEPFAEQAIVGFGVGMTLLDIAFDRLGLSRVVAHVLRSNERAIRYNLALGYQRCAAQAGQENQRYEITPERFRESISSIRKLFVARCSIDIEFDS